MLLLNRTEHLRGFCDTLWKIIAASPVQIAKEQSEPFKGRRFVGGHQKVLRRKRLRTSLRITKNFDQCVKDISSTRLVNRLVVHHRQSTAQNVLQS